MNDDLLPLANDYVDDALSDDERRLAEADPAVMAAVAELVAVRDALRRSEAPSVGARESAIAAAMSAFADRTGDQTPDPAMSQPVEPVAPAADPDELRSPATIDRSSRHRSWSSRLLPIAAAVVAVAALGVVITQLTPTDDESVGYETADSGRFVDRIESAADADQADAAASDATEGADEAKVEMGVAADESDAPTSQLGSDDAELADAELADVELADAEHESAEESSGDVDTDASEADESAAAEAGPGAISDDGTSDAATSRDWARLAASGPVAELDPSLAGMSILDPIESDDQLAEFARQLQLATGVTPSTEWYAEPMERCRITDAITGPAMVSIIDTIYPALVVIRDADDVGRGVRHVDAVDWTECEPLLTTLLP